MPGRLKGPGSVPTSQVIPVPAQVRFDREGEPSSIERHLPAPIDMRGMSDWETVLSVDCSERSWGQVLISCEAQASPTVANATDPENWPWVEVRIIADVNSQRVILLEAAVGSHNSPVIGDGSKSSGPVFLPLYPGEVPDRIEVHARARRGGMAETRGDPDEVLLLVPVARFHE